MVSRQSKPQVLICFSQMGPVNALFWNLVSAWRHSCVLVWMANLHILRMDEAMAPPLDPWTPWRLITTPTATMADYMLVLVLQKILSLSGFLCHYAERKRIMTNRICHIVFFLLCSVSSSTVCLYTVCKLYVHAPSLPMHFLWISSPTCRSGIWTKACWAFYNGFGRKYSWNNAEEECVFKHIFITLYCWQCARDYLVEFRTHVDHISIFRLQPAMHSMIPSLLFYSVNYADSVAEYALILACDRYQMQDVWGQGWKK